MTFPFGPESIVPVAADVGSYPPSSANAEWFANTRPLYVLAALTGYNANTTLAIGANKLYLVPFVAVRDLLIDLLAIYVTVAAAGNVRLGLYSTAAAAPFRPQALMFDSGNIDVSANGQKSSAAGINVKLFMGRQYWAAIATSAAITLMAIPGNAIGLSQIGNLNLGLGNTMPPIGFDIDRAFAALSDPLGAIPSIGATQALRNFAPAVYAGYA